MPLSPFQKQILQLLTSQRRPKINVAGGSPIALRTERLSSAFDIFNDREELVAEAALKDGKVIEAAGYELRWIHQYPSMWSAVVLGGPEPLKIDWAQDSAYRFYPAQEDEDFGYVLHPADLATNKVIAAASRSEPRDLFDLVALSRDVPIAAAIIAAPAKDRGFTPETLCRNISMFGRHQPEAFDQLRSSQRIDGLAVLQGIRSGLLEAMQVAARLPTQAVGKLFFQERKIVVPQADQLHLYVAKEAHTGGVLPTIHGQSAADIAARYQGFGR